MAIPTPTRRDTSAPRLCSRLRPPARPWGQLLIALTRHVPRFKVATPSATFRSPPPRKRPAVCKPAVLFAVELGARHPSRLALALDQRAAQPSPTAVDGGHAAPCACPHGRRRRTEAGVAGSGEALQGRDQEGCPPRRGLWPHGSAGPGRDGRWARSPGPGRPGQLLFLLEGRVAGRKVLPPPPSSQTVAPCLPSLSPWVSRRPTRVPGPGTERKRCSQDPRLQTPGS